MKTNQFSRLFIATLFIFSTHATFADTTIITTNDDHTSTVTTMPDNGPGRITTVITPSVLSSSTETVVDEDGNSKSTTVTAPVTPGVDTPSTTTIITDDNE